MNTCLVIGAGGFIGRSLCHSLVEEGKYQVIATDSEEHLLRPFDSLKNLTPMVLNICQSNDVEKVFAKVNPEKVIHLASVMGVKECRLAPSDCLLTNVVGLQNVLSACVQNKTEHFVYTSSSNVYGCGTPPFSEDGPLSPEETYYPFSKYIAEKLVKIFTRDHGISSAVLRIFNVFGPWQRRDRVFMELASSIIKREPVRIYGTGEASRDYLYVDDCVKAIILAKELDCRHEVINIGSGRSTTVGEIAALLGMELGIKPCYEYIPYRSHDIVHTRADITKARELLGFKPEYTLTTGVCAFVQWFSDNYSVEMRVGD